MQRAEVTLHVGIDTFRPISTKKIDEHAMHSEWCAISQETVAAIRRTQKLNQRVVAVAQQLFDLLKTRHSLEQQSRSLVRRTCLSALAILFVL